MIALACAMTLSLTRRRGNYAQPQNFYIAMPALVPTASSLQVGSRGWRAKRLPGRRSVLCGGELDKLDDEGNVLGGAVSDTDPVRTASGDVNARVAPQVL